MADPLRPFIAGHRHPDHASSVDGAHAVATSAVNNRIKMLVAIDSAGPTGMNAWEAAVEAGMTGVSYWQRMSELRDLGLITFRYYSDGQEYRRMGRTAVMITVSVITKKGRHLLSGLGQ